jgi:hypothetical protein
MALSSLATMTAAHRVYGRLGYAREPGRDWAPLPGVDLLAFSKTFRPEIVCICGSTRFVAEMRAANRDLTVAGAIVLAPGEAGGTGGVVTDEQKVALDALHLSKIDLADRVLVVNPGGYVGESTRREIAHARATGKPVSFTDPA